VRTHTGYNWFLHDRIREQTIDGLCQPAYDLCIIDGPKNWTIDGDAFFLADKLLRPGAALIFDDVDYTYATWAREHGREALDGVNHNEMSPAEIATPQIREVAELLVMQHPDYGDFRFTDTDWFLARKRSDPDVAARKTIEYQYLVRPGDMVRRQVRRAVKGTKKALAPRTSGLSAPAVSIANDLVDCRSSAAVMRQWLTDGRHPQRASQHVALDGDVTPDGRDVLRGACERWWWSATASWCRRRSPRPL
jgi:hypothetical protein